MNLPETSLGIIMLTDAAADAVKEMIAAQNWAADVFLRVYVSGGGCSGLQYGLALDEVQDDSDEVVEDNGVHICIDPVSLKYMSGSTVDFVQSDMGGGFKIDNPKSTNGCGCGQSFQADGAPTGGCSGCNSCG